MKEVETVGEYLALSGGLDLKLPFDDMSDATAHDHDSVECLLNGPSSADLELAAGRMPSCYTIDELNRHYGSSSVHSALHDSASRPSRLGYVVLLHGANPRWATDRVVFAHQNIHLLPGYDRFKQQLNPIAPGQDGTKTPDDTDEWEIISKEDVDEIGTSQPSPQANRKDGTSSTASAACPVTQSHPSPSGLTNLQSQTQDQGPIPIFFEHPNWHGARKLSFYGYYDIAKVTFLKPHSAEVIAPLSQQQQNRDDQPFASSPPATQQRNLKAHDLAQEWAIVHFRPTLEAHGDPEIKRSLTDRVDCELPARNGAAAPSARGQQQKSKPKHYRPRPSPQWWTPAATTIPTPAWTSSRPINWDPAPAPAPAPAQQPQGEQRSTPTPAAWTKPLAPPFNNSNNNYDAAARVDSEARLERHLREEFAWLRRCNRTSSRGQSRDEDQSR